MSYQRIMELEAQVTKDSHKTKYNSAFLVKAHKVSMFEPEETVKDVDALLKILQPAKEAAILDLCCGYGRHLLELARRGFTQLHGIDSSTVMLELANQTIREQGLEANVTITPGDLTEGISYPDNTFDYITCLANSLCNFPEKADQDTLLHHAWRTLKPGGYLFLDITDDVFVKTQLIGNTWFWLEANLMFCRERRLSDRDNSILLSREFAIDVNKGIVADDVYAFKLHSFEALSQSLSEVGFSSLRFELTIGVKDMAPGEIGMMAKRNILTAKKE